MKASAAHTIINYGTRPHPVPRPFVKWVGGKRQLLEVIRPHIPPKFGTYYEPFLGGGALFFDTLPKKAMLSDMNERLVRTYKGIRDSVEAVMELLRTYPYDKDFFYEMRTRAIDNGSDVEVAAWFIYLNKAGFNGLYRVNSRNIFNVPFGRMGDPNICDEQNLKPCSLALAGATIRHESFEEVANRAKRGDFVYFDPPYIPLSVTSKFASYTAGGFDSQAQLRLRDVALDLKQRGVHVLLSNSSAPAVYELYKQDFECITVSATRRVNATVAGRGAITELLLK